MKTTYNNVQYKMPPAKWLHLRLSVCRTSRRRRDDVGNGLRPDRRLWDGLFRLTDVVCLQGVHCTALLGMFMSDSSTG